MVFFSLLFAGLIGLVTVNSNMPLVSTQETFLGENEASIRWPVVHGEFSGLSRINELLDYSSITGETLEETRENYRLYGTGIVGSFFQVNWTDADFIDLTITVETLGAYPSSRIFNYLFSTESGEIVIAQNLFLEEKISELVQLCNGELQNRITTETVGQHQFTLDNLNDIGVRRSGIVFYYDFQYPHAIAANEPDGKIFFYWSDVNEFLLPEFRR